MKQKEAKTDLTRTLIASSCVVLLLVGSIWVMSPFLFAILWATTIVVATWSLFMRLEKRIGRRGVAVAIMVVAMGLIVLVPLGLGVSALISGGEVLGRELRNLDQVNIPPPPDWIAKIPMRGPSLSAEWRELSQSPPEVVSAKLRPYVRNAAAWVIAGVGGMGMMVVNLLLTFIVIGILYATGEKAANSVLRFAKRLDGARGEGAVILAGKSIKSVAMGIIVTALVQTVLAGVGLWLAGVPYAAILTAVVLVFCIVQLGPLIPMLCAAAWLFHKGFNTTGGIFLAYSLAIGLIDNFLRPILIRRGADLPFLLIFSGVVGGLLAFGVMGLFIGPVILAITYTLGNSWMDEADEQDWPEVLKSYRTDTDQIYPEI